MLSVEEDRAEFTSFVAQVEPRLRRAFTILRGPEDGRDATAEALAWAWQNWIELREMDNPAGYLYRVGASRTRRRRQRFPAASHSETPQLFEPGLVPALARLTERQRTVVALIHGCGWTHQEVADALELSRSSVGTHLDRAMTQLREELGVEGHG
ncbi:MAG TPA: sigma-70 family RNA polymerase sigma factor [Microthrixaceae bacterium]|nr:sigma-70 family RNA polymerase sigma factor [Microthrixaceae bacterium]